MNLYRIFSWKFLLALIAGLAVLWISPDYIYAIGYEKLAQAQTPNLPGLAPEKIAATPPAPKAPATTPTAPKAGPAGKQEEVPAELMPKGGAPSIVTQAAVLSFLSLMPFIVMILTSFLKIVIVLSLLRTALGVQQAPPNAIINGVGFMLSLFIMYPTGLKMYEAGKSVIERQQTPESIMDKQSPMYILEVVAHAREPLRDFLRKNSSVKHQRTFYRTAYRIIPEANRESLKPEDFMVLIPSFITSQLKDAFEIGVLIYIPFFVIDLVTSNILLAMGMMMLSPVTISMPLKLFLLVMLDGWTLLIEGLVNTFVQ